MVKIFISGFSFGMNELELAQLVSLHGTVLTLQIATDKKTNLSKGYAFIGMKNQIDAAHVIEALNGRSFDGRELTVRLHIEPVKIPARSIARPAQASIPAPSAKNTENAAPETGFKRKRQRKQA